MVASTARPAILRLARGLDWLADRTRERVAIDLRALATFRIALGSLVLADLLLRARFFRAFYTDEGVYPTSFLDAALSYPYSIHALDGSVAFQAFLFVVAGLFAVSLLLGYRTRVAVVVSWILLLSLHNRTPVVLNAGDVLLRTLLFWGIFLPLGERWSIDGRRVDARRADRDRTRAASLATLAILLQVVLVYAVNAIHKLRSEEWSYGNAAGTVVQLDQFAVYLGPYVAEYPFLLRPITRLWLVLVVCSPLLLVLTGWRRALFATAFVGMHLGMAATMQLGLFPLISVASLLVFYPPFVWNRIEDLAVVDRLGTALASGLDWAYRRDVLPSLPTGAAGARGAMADRLRSGGSHVATVVLALLLPMILVSAVASVGYADAPDRTETALERVEMDQAWGMFAPDPPTTSRYYVAEGTLTDGTQVDPLLEGSEAYEPPPDAMAASRSMRWRKYLGFVRPLTPTSTPDYFGRYLCDRWNRTHDSTLSSVSVTAFERPVDSNGSVESQERDVVLSDYDCSGDLHQA